MEHASAINIPPIESAEKINAIARPQVLKKSDLAQSDVGIFVLLTLLLVGIGRVLGSWICCENIKIQKGPNEFVSRSEEYQNLHNQVGPNTFFRLY